jgi:hypothetical protein
LDEISALAKNYAPRCRKAGTVHCDRQNCGVVSHLQPGTGLASVRDVQAKRIAIIQGHPDGREAAKTEVRSER